MDDCPDCIKTKYRSAERSHHSPRKRRYRAVSERRRRHSPMGCGPCIREDLHLPRKPFLCDPCPPPCRDRCCYPERTESGLLNTIRSSIQRLFTGKKTNQFYMYSMSQLKFIEQLLDKMEDEVYCFEDMIKQALECECSIDFNNLSCSLNFISDRVEGVKSDLACARDCYNPCRDRCEFELICCLMERVSCLEQHLQGLSLHVECLQASMTCDTFCMTRATCRPKRCCGSCKSPCITQGCLKPSGRSTRSPGCDTGCRTVCLDKPKCCGPKNLGKLGDICSPKGICRTSSVIPVGVMLVKL